jgi:general secretion pathway protein G
MPGLWQRKKGFTFVEMLVTLTILAILAAAIMPLAKTAVKREKEIELRRNLRLIREALDAYKKLADEKMIEVEEDSEGYPPDLETLVKGVEAKASQAESQPQLGRPSAARSSAKSGSEKRIVKFLRRIPRDPMTDSIDWGLRSYQDEPDEDDWGGENVYDIYTKSPGTALDGTKYRDW